MIEPATLQERIEMESQAMHRACMLVNHAPNEGERVKAYKEFKRVYIELTPKAAGTLDK